MFRRLLTHFGRSAIFAFSPSFPRFFFRSANETETQEQTLCFQKHRKCLIFSRAKKIRKKTAWNARNSCTLRKRRRYLLFRWTVDQESSIIINVSEQSTILALIIFKNFIWNARSSCTLTERPPRGPRGGPGLSFPHRRPHPASRAPLVGGGFERNTPLETGNRKQRGGGQPDPS